jgi:hypothetical protein
MKACVSNLAITRHAVMMRIAFWNNYKRKCERYLCTCEDGKEPSGSIKMWGISGLAAKTD